MTGYTYDIPNLHPSRRGSICSSFDDTLSDNRSVKDHIESFVGSYSRTSMVHMAENVLVGDEMRDDDDTCSTLSRYRHDPEGSIHERTSLLYGSLQKINTMSSIITVADAYQVETPCVKKSSFLQSVFNCVNILIGVGILALPLGMKLTGWITGCLVFAFCFALTNYTAKLLAKCLEDDPNSCTYGDMGANAFGMKGRVFISSLFITELTLGSVALVVLLSDGIESLFPEQNYYLIRLVSFLILTPTLFIPVHHLSYTSVLGIVSIFSLIAVILYDGLSKAHAPGSLREMADTTILPAEWTLVPKSFGLIMAGFAGHAVFPTIYRNMKTPKEYNKMVDVTYLVTAIVYLMVAISGYAMFGSQTMQEISQNIVLIPEYNQALNKLAVWLIALNPVAKYGLTLNPVILSCQLGLANNSYFDEWVYKSVWKRQVLNALGIISISSLVVILSIVLPNFDQIMSLLGALFSFIISGIFPILCNLKQFKSTLSKWETFFNYALIIVASVLAIAGTIGSLV